MSVGLTASDAKQLSSQNSVVTADVAGTIKPVWSGVAAVNMTSEAGMKMDGYIYENCSIIVAGVNSGIWFRKGATPPAPPAPPTFAPSQPPSPSSPDVVWDTPSEDVTGSMPLGNGRLGINVWVDDTSTIGIMMSHVDALDENAILSKLGRVLIRVVPSPPRPASSEQRNYTIRPGMIGPQPPIGTVKCDNQSGCPHVAAAACDAFPSCDGFGLNPTWNSGQVAELYSGSLTSATPSYSWTLWKNADTPGPPPPAPRNTQPFRMEYWLRNMSVRIQLPTVENVTVDVWVDANADVVRVSSSSDLPHRIEATLQIWRNSTAPYPFASTSWCSSLHPNVSRHADTVVSRTDSILFYHRVTAEYASMWETDLSNQQMPKGLPNVLINNTFGGLLSGGADGQMVSSGPMSIVSATGRVSQTLSIAGIADVYPKVQDFIGQLEALSVKPADPVAHSTSWSEFWSGSDISIKPAVAPNDTAIAGAAALVTRLDRVNRATFYSMALGKHAIKFNSYGIYSAYAGPGQEDYRVWGECQWVSERSSN